MVSKTITIVQPSKKKTNNNAKNRYWSVNSQAALDSLLRKYQVDVLLDTEYACEVNRYDSLLEGGEYTLGDSFSSSMELQVWNNKDA